jgi:hypothetical protein
MSINTHILLPVQARIEDVVQVMGILSGLPARLEPLYGNHGTHVVVEGAMLAPSAGQFGCGNICLKAQSDSALIDGYQDHSCFVVAVAHNGAMAGYNTKCGIWISTGVSPFWETVAVGLVRFFGGEVDFNDCDQSDCDFAWPLQPDITACDDEAWEAFQQRKMAVKPASLAKGEASCA